MAWGIVGVLFVFWWKLNEPEGPTCPSGYVPRRIVGRDPRTGRKVVIT